MGSLHKLDIQSRYTGGIVHPCLQAWTYVYSTRGVQGYWNNYELFDGLPAAGKFVLWNNIGMPMVSGGTVGSWLRLHRDFTAHMLSATTMAVSKPYDF